MNWLDAAIATVVAVCVVRSFVRGAVREVFSLGALLGGYLVASHTHPYGAAVLLRWISSHAIARGVSFLASFLFAALLIGFMGRLVHRLVRDAQLSWPNRLVGGALGLAEGSALVAVGLLVVGSLTPPRWDPLRRSQLAPHFRPVTAALARLGSADLTSPLPRRLRERRRWMSLPAETRVEGSSRDKGRRGKRPKGISEEDSRKLEAIIQKGG